MRFLPGNAQHIGARHSQQDSFGFGDPGDQGFIAHAGFLAVVCDGMGGMEYGDAASRTAVRAFLDGYRRKTSAESIPAALQRSVHEANAQVVALANSLGLSDGIGTTLVAAALLDRSLYFISVGDSGLFLCSGGQARMLNRPHIFANMLDAAVARGAMSRQDAEEHPERESLTSYIGAAALEEIDRNPEPWPLQDGDTILLASDGMFKTLDTEEIAACLQGSPQSWPEALVEKTLAKKREYQDNVTVLSVTLDSETSAPVSPMAPAAVTASPSRAEAPAPWAPPVQQQIGPAPGFAPPRALRSSRWLIAAALLVALAAAIAAWWYRTRAMDSIDHPRPVDPAQRVDAPPRHRPVDLTPDPNAPLAPPPHPRKAR